MTKVSQPIMISHIRSKKGQPFFIRSALWKAATPTIISIKGISKNLAVDHLIPCEARGRLNPSTNELSVTSPPAPLRNWEGSHSLLLKEKGRACLSDRQGWGDKNAQVCLFMISFLNCILYYSPKGEGQKGVFRDALKNKNYKFTPSPPLCFYTLWAGRPFNRIYFGSLLNLLSSTSLRNAIRLLK